MPVCSDSGRFFCEKSLREREREREQRSIWQLGYYHGRVSRGATSAGDGRSLVARRGRAVNAYQRWCHQCSVTDGSHLNGRFRTVRFRADFSLLEPSFDCQSISGRHYERSNDSLEVREAAWEIESLGVIIWMANWSYFSEVPRNPPHLQIADAALWLLQIRRPNDRINFALSCPQSISILRRS